ncbi:MAG TPA: hypothetical protein VEQ85_08135 [Lacipirellulaceae bacterium]|nr:hypothetical protein [Lacipirellulaceae bacterium]
MSRRERPPGPSPDAATAKRPLARPAAPPKHPWQLAVSSLLMVLWIALLAWMAWR